MGSLRLGLGVLLIGLIAVGGTSCKKKFEIQDVPADKAGRVRSLGPESQDVIALSDKMVRSILELQEVTARSSAPIVHMLPMENNTRFAFNQEVFTSRLKAQLNEDANRRLLFRSADTWEEMEKEREMKRAGEVDYDPDLRAKVPVGADYFLKGRADGLSNASTKGQSQYIIYTFKLVDAETGIEIWERAYETKKEGKDDLLYR